MAMLMLLAAMLPIASVVPLALMVVSIGVLIWRSDLSLSAWTKGLYRLKWLFLSITILYCWFTPGVSIPGPDWLPFPINLPSYAGLEIALARSLVLVVLYGAVLLCLYPLQPEEVVAGLRWLCRPLAIIGLPVDLFSARVAATLTAIQQIQASLKKSALPMQAGSLVAWVNSVADRGAAAIAQVESNAVNSLASPATADIRSLGSGSSAEKWLVVVTALTIVASVVFL